MQEVLVCAIYLHHATCMKQNYHTVTSLWRHNKLQPKSQKSKQHASK